MSAFFYVRQASAGIARDCIVRERLSAYNRLAAAERKPFGLLYGVRIRLSAGLPAAGRKPFGLLLWVQGRLTAGIACGKGLRALPCTRKGHRPLTRNSSGGPVAAFSAGAGCPFLSYGVAAGGAGTGEKGKFRNGPEICGKV